MMQLWQRELFTAMLRGLELIVVALRKVLEEDKQQRRETNTMVVDMSIKTVSVDAVER
jgi:hypothetical protein